MIQKEKQICDISLKIKKQQILIAWFICLALLLPGCSAFNCTPLENLLGGTTDLINFSYKIADNPVDKAVPPLIPGYSDMPILVTTFVNNNNLNQTSQFGRILQEHIASRLVQLGYSVKEIKLADTLTIEPESGKTILSRDLSLLSGTQQAQEILVGTLSQANRTMYG